MELPTTRPKAYCITLQDGTRRSNVSYYPLKYYVDLKIQLKPNLHGTSQSVLNSAENVNRKLNQ